MYYVGKLDLAIYSCIASDIATDEVIITDERIQHIKERRGSEFYAEYSGFFAEIIARPDYIFRDTRKNTALVCKTFAYKGATVNLVLRLAVEGDDPSYKNSVITAIKENEKRFEQRLRNNEPVYRRID